MGLPYLNIHYELMQSDLSAPKYTICLFLSYIFLCSHTQISAILVVSGAYYSCSSYSAISSGGIPFQVLIFQNLTTPMFIKTLPWNMTHSHFSTQVWECVCFANASKVKSIFGGTVQSLVSFFKSLSKAENVLQIQETAGQAAESCKPFQDYKSDSEWLEGCRLFHH